MSRITSVRVLALAASVVIVACPVARIQAERMPVYNLDSLVHLSSDIAEAQITRSFKAGEVDLIEVKVSLVHKGEFKKGQVVAVAHTDSYRKPTKDFNSRQLEVGDRLVLFLVRAKPNEFNRIPENAVIYAPWPSGMRLIQDDQQVLVFRQWDSPGPYVAQPIGDGKDKTLTLKQLRKNIDTSLRDTQEWAKLIEAKQDKLDVPRLLKLLEARSKQNGGRDYFTERICIRFAASYDFDLLSRALPMAKSYNDAPILRCGFGTAKGRDYLLAKVTDEKEPMPARLRFAQALHDAGAVYRSTYIDISSNSHRVIGAPDKENSGYITRIAKAAGANAKHEELCRSLIRCIDYFSQGITQNKAPAVMEDLSGSLAVLMELYDTKPSQELQFRIETATAWLPESYDKLKSPCGAFISILRRADPERYTKPEKRSLIFEYEYTTVLMPRGVEVQPAVVLVHQKTQKRHVLPTSLKIRGWQTGGGSNSVELPSDLPAGRYHVFFELKERDRVVSMGHYFAADL